MCHSAWVLSQALIPQECILLIKSRLLRHTVDAPVCPADSGIFLIIILTFWILVLVSVNSWKPLENVRGLKSSCLEVAEKMEIV